MFGRMTTKDLALRALAALDLTTLGEDDTPTQVAALCARARTPHGAVAAVCVYPEHIVASRAQLEASGSPTVRVATVTNFPDGAADAERAVRETRRAVAAGAHEVDVVFPWRALLAGDEDIGARIVAGCRDAMPAGTSLKVILETGELRDATLIRRACDIALRNGADFLKTSTGKVAVNATPEAARIMLDAIVDYGAPCGLKVAGGIRKVADVATYFDLADARMGPAWATPARFRIGASALLDDVLAMLDGRASGAADGY
ncbi:MAG: deoxyribose-phosphate aldolase [Lysobacter sp.]|nr:deoxyribose-phosphate aldolase [Lysobacter sp.]